MLSTDREADSSGLDTLLFEFLLSELRMGSRSGVDNEGLNVSHISEEREDSEVIDKLLSIVLRALYIEGKDTAAAVGEVFFIDLVAWLRAEGRMVNSLYLRMSSEVLNDLLSVGGMTFNAEGESFQTL